MKIFQIGFNKCGTSSLYHFFKGNGIASVHLDGFDDDSDDYFPCVHAYINYFTELDKQYPNSKFILNRRNLIKWIKSRQSHVFGSGRTYLGSYMHHMKMTEEEVLTLWENQWNAHISNVLEYFKDRPNDLLVFNIEEDDATKIKDFFSEDLDLDVSHWKQHNQTGSLIPITITEKAKKDKKGRIILWSRDD